LVTTDKAIEIQDGFYFLPDGESKFSGPNEIDKSSFQRITENSFNPETKVYWLQFALTNTSSVQTEFVLDFQNWSLVDFYFEDNGGYTLKQTGHLMPYKQRDYPMANKSYILVNIPDEATINCIVKLESRYNNEMIPTSLGFKVAPKTIVEQENSSVGLIIFFFLGIFSIIFVYNFFLAVSTKMKSYWYYLPVVLFAFYHTAYNSGYLIPIFGWFQNFPIVLTWFETISSPLFSIVVLLFAQNLLKTADRYVLLNKFINGTIIFLVITAIVTIVSVEIGMLMIALASIMVLVLVTTAAIKSVRDKQPSSIFFLVGFSAFMIGGLITVLAVVGAIPMTKFTFNYAFPLGSVIEVSLFSFALANLINVLKRENALKQQRIIEQLEENQQLQTKVNRELEEKVLERTLQINEQKDLILKQKDEISTEKEKSDSLLTNILPESIAEELKENGKSTPKYFKSASVLFTDFKDFTLIAEKLGPKQLVQELDYCFRAFDDIVSRNGLEKIKTIGDSYMAVGGVPKEDDAHATHACKAGLEIIAFINDWNSKKAANGDFVWEIRAGINSGPLIAGVVGKKKFAFDVWGDTVNIASRMESNGLTGRLNVSSETYTLIKDDFNCSLRGKAEIKGKGEMEMYFVDEK
jgi:class 3 adenylate cyclase